MEYIRQRQTIATHFTNRSYQLRPKATPVRKHNLVTLTTPHKDKLLKPRKVNVGKHPRFLQRNWLAMVRAKEVEATKQAPTYTQPPKASATASAAQSSATQTSVTQSTLYCAICIPLGKLCPSEYPITADWQDNSKKEEESQEQIKDDDDFSVCLDWETGLEEQDWKK